MRTTVLWLGTPAFGAAWVVVAACNSSGTALPPQDGGASHDAAVITFDGPTPFDAGTFVDSASPDDASDEGDGEAGPTPPSTLLLTYNGSASSELVAFGLASKAVDGRMTYADPIGTAFVGPTAPWLLEQTTDVVARLDAQQPWKVDASWNVAMNDYADAGFAASYSDPQAVIVNALGKAYVLRYTRNLVAVIDTTQAPDGGTPIASIDLSSELQAGGDGYVQPVAGVYVASQNRVYVVLGNINRGDVVNDGYNLECASTTPTVIAIDTTHDALVDLNGSAKGNGFPLGGFDPILGPGAIAFDPSTGASGRLLVLEAGCNEVAGDGGVGALVKREVEAIDLATGTSTELLDLTAGGFPGSLTYIDAHHAIVQTETAYAWDPTTTTLGAAVANAPDSFAYDGTGSLVGLSSNYAADGGFEGYSIVSVPLDGGAPATLGTNPFTLTNGFPGGVALWPSP